MILLRKGIKYQKTMNNNVFNTIIVEIKLMESTIKLLTCYTSKYERKRFPKSSGGSSFNK